MSSKFQEKYGLTIITSNKIDFKAKNFTRNKDGHSILIK